MLLQVAHSTLGYLWEEVFHPTQQLPLRLTQGSPEEQLSKLSEVVGVSVLDPLSKKVRALLGMRFPRARIVRGLVLMREVLGATGLVEQNHEAGAVLLRRHEAYNEAALRSRSLVRQARHLVGESLHERRCARIAARLTKLEAKASRTVSARNVFFRGVCRQAQGAPLSGRAAFEHRQRLLQRPVGLFDQLKRGARREFEHMEEFENLSRAKAIEDERLELLSHLRMLESRAKEEVATVGILNHSGNFRFSESVLRCMCDIYQGAGGQPLTLAGALARQLEAPTLPPVAVQELFLEAEKVFDFLAPACPWWCRYICAFREHFRHCALTKGFFGDGNGVAYLVLFAKQNPYTAVFLGLREAHASDCRHEGNDESIWRHRHRYYAQFACTGFVHKSADELPFHADDKALFVLRGIQIDGGVAHTFFAPVRFEVFVAPLGEVGTKSASSQQPRPKRPAVSEDVQAKLMAEHPWLTASEFGSVGGAPRGHAGGRSGGGSSSSGGGASAPLPRAMGGPRPRRNNCRTTRLARRRSIRSS